MKHTTCPLPPIIPIIVGIISISFAPIFVKWSNAPESVQAMYRLIFTVLLMLPFGGPYIKSIAVISNKNWMILTLSGIFLALHFLLWMSSLDFTTVASSTILMTLEPIFVMVGSFLFFRERIRRSAIGIMGITIIGAALIGWGDIGLSRSHIFGDILSILGTIAMAGSILAAQYLLKHLKPFVYSFFVFLVGAGVLVLYNVVMEIEMIAYPLQEWVIFALLAVVPTVLGHILFNWLMQYVNGTTVSMCVLGEPIGASILAALLFGEVLTTHQIVGGIIVIFGLYMFLKVNKPSSEFLDNPNVKAEAAVSSNLN